MLKRAGYRRGDINQIRMLDLQAKKGRKVESVPDFIVEDALARLQAVLE